MSKISPPGLAANAIVTRFASAKPETYDAKARSVDAVLSTGAAVKRSYGTERLSMDPRAVALGRMASSGIPFLDSHDQRGIDKALGRIEKVWFEGGQLMGSIAFNDTDG